MVVSRSLVGFVCYFFPCALCLTTGEAFAAELRELHVDRIDLKLDMEHRAAKAIDLNSSDQVIEADNPEVAAEFGTSVAFGERGLLVGAHRQGSGQGRVYHFESTPGAFSMGVVDQFTPSSASVSAMFGGAIALEGDLAAIAAPLDNGAVAQTGTVYIYRYDGGKWLQAQKLFAANGNMGDRFGAALAMRGGILAIGAPGTDLREENAGAVHWYRADANGSFQEMSVLAPEDLRAQDGFGKSVALGETGLCVGAPGTDLASLDNAGAAYWFKTQPSGWGSPRRLTAQDVQKNAQFGRSLALASGVLAIGAPGELRGTQRNVGSVFIHSIESSGEPSFAQKILPSRVQADLYFGWSLALDQSGQSLAIGAFGYDGDAVAAGAVSFWRRQASATWREELRLVASDPSPRDYLGRSVAIFGKQIVAGARGRDVGAALAGAAYVFELDTVPAPLAPISILLVFGAGLLGLRSQSLADKVTP